MQSQVCFMWNVVCHITNTPTWQTLCASCVQILDTPCCRRVSSHSSTGGLGALGSLCPSFFNTTFTYCARSLIGRLNSSGFQVFIDCSLILNKAKCEYQEGYGHDKR